MNDINKVISIDEAKKIYKENNHKIINSELNSFVSLKNINKIYPNKAQAVYNFNLDIQKKEFIALVGPSGCGKSTTLRMIAGLEEITSGHLYIDGVLSNYLPSKNRDIAMVFQSYALYPQLNVYDNIAFGLKIRKMDKNEIQERVFRAADILNLGDYLDRKPKELSGGQMQRVALGRAIVRNAKLFLMDEPLSNLDAKLRVQMRSEIVRIHEEVNATTIYVTHDQVEAMTMADKIVVMNEGFIQQVGAPLEVYHNPTNMFVATFIGVTPMNMLKARYEDGVLNFNSNYQIKLSNEIIKKYQKFINNKIQTIENLLKENNEEDIRLFVLNNTNYRKKFIVKNNYESKKKIFKKKNQTQNISIEKYIDALKEMLAKYQNNINNYHDINVGFRPEIISIVETKQNDTLEVYTDIVEILGNEFIAHANSKIGKITIKSAEPIKSHQNINIKIKKEMLYIFDDISQENIKL